jgi:hypothetical protein
VELWAAALIGVLATLPWNFFCAVPAIWDVWRTTAPRVVSVAGKL